MKEEEFTQCGGYGSGCEIHGEGFLRECTMCGIEFCSVCFPQSTLCPDCAAQGDSEIGEEEPTEEEKGLLLLDGFNDDEPAAATPVNLPIPPAKKAAAAPTAKKSAKPSPKAKVKTTKAAPKAKPKAKAKAKSKKPAKPAPKAKAKAKAKKPAKSAPKKRKA